MALTTTTLSAAVVVTDNTIKVTSATGFVAGMLIVIDQEAMQVAQSYSSGTTIPVLRGRDGTVTAAHPITANVNVELASDLAGPIAQAVTQYPMGRYRVVTSSTAAGAIALPPTGADGLWILNGTVAKAMTLANPTKDMDGSLLWIASNGKAAHTVTYSAGLGNAGAGYTVATFTTGAQQTLTLLAINGIWQQAQSHFSGTLTAILIALA